MATFPLTCGRCLPSLVACRCVEPTHCSTFLVKTGGGEALTAGAEWRGVGRMCSPRAIPTPPRSSLMLCASVERAGAFESAVGGSWKAMCA